jgi:hypothetical protein
MGLPELLADEANRYRSFRLEMNTEVTGLLWVVDQVAGVTAQTPGGQWKSTQMRDVAGRRHRSQLRPRRSFAERSANL